MSRNDDPQLGEIFDELRRKDASSSPAFQEVWNRAMSARSPSRTAPRKWRLALAAGLVAVIVMTVWLVQPRRLPEPMPEPQLSNWKAPTDFLLKTPGSELLERLPEIPSNGSNQILQSIRQNSQEKPR